MYAILINIISHQRVFGKGALAYQPVKLSVLCCIFTN